MGRGRVALSGEARIYLPVIAGLDPAIPIMWHGCASLILLSQKVAGLPFQNQLCGEIQAFGWGSA
jgi:hypothetical protein